MKAALYLRVSTASQTDGASLPQQLAELTAYAEEQAWDVVEVYQEAASSWRGVRSEYERLILDGLSGRFARILVWSLDRFGRRAGRLHYDIERLAQVGCYVVSVHQHADLSSDDMASVAIRHALAMAAELENCARVERTRMAVDHRRGLGLFIGTAPLGYTHVAGKLQAHCIDDEAAELVRRIFELYDGRRSLQDIADLLNNDGQRTRRGKLFGPNAVYRILKQHKYAGTETEAQLIDAETLERAGQILRQHGRSPRTFARQLRPALLKGVIFDTAGHRLYVNWLNGGYVYYRCPICRKAIPDRLLAPQVDALIQSLRLPESWQEAVNELLRHSEVVQGAERQRLSLSGKLSRLNELYVDGAVDKAEYLKRRAELQRQLDAIQTPTVSNLARAGELLQSLPVLWEAANVEERNHLLRSIYARLVVDVEGLQFVAAEMFPEIAAALGHY